MATDARRDAILDSRFATLVNTGVDAGALSTWDPGLSRRTRILVPADVQAYVVRPGGTEPTVAVTGGPGDPPPFDTGTPRPAGVHLHWAMPDALLSGGHSTQTGALALPALPDRWVVVRTLQPVGGRQVQATGWVIDAKAGSSTPLGSYAGTPAPAPAGAQRLDPLDGAAGGSLMWTGSYTAAAGRFTFYDPLSDLPTGGAGYHDNQCVYTVAGWWSDISADPLAAAAGATQLDAALAALGWYVNHDDDTSSTPAPGSGQVVARTSAGLDTPAESVPVEVVRPDGSVSSGALTSGVFQLAPPVDAYDRLIVVDPAPRYATLVHGSVLGVPIAGALPGADDRPDPTGVGVAIGQDTDDVVAAFGASVGPSTPAQRRTTETLLAAFASGMLDTLVTPDGLEDLAERQHGDGFWSLQGAPLPGLKPDRLAVTDAAAAGPLNVGRKGRAAAAGVGAGAGKGDRGTLGTKLDWSQRSLTLRDDAPVIGRDKGASPRTDEVPVTRADLPQSRQVTRPAPRYFRPQPPMLALRGAHPNHRHHGDGLYDDSGRLLCRYPGQCVTQVTGVAAAATVLAGLGSGAIPDEVLTVVREAVLLNPYGYQWLAAAAAPAGATTAAAAARLGAEMVRLYGTDGRYDAGTRAGAARPAGGAAPAAMTAAGAGGWAGRSARDTVLDHQLGLELAKHSLIDGMPPSPVALTTWRQPWVPLWVEWRVRLDGTDTASGWTLDGIDLQPPPAAAGGPVGRTLLGRSPLGQGISAALQQGITKWLYAEQQREATGAQGLPAADDKALADLADLVVPLDLMSASLDGVREQLLGIAYIGVVERGTGPDPRPRATDLPVPLFGGALRLDALRLVDAFGRCLDLPATATGNAVTTSDLQLPEATGGMWLRPRLQHSARWLFRLVDPAQPAATDPDQLHEAFVDQLNPAGAVNPVAGFLLPDHIDEELEAFTAAGDPIGQIGHDAVSGAVTWEPAPGRPVPPDAGPLADLDAHARITGEIAAGLVAADARARALPTPPASSALSALLRAIDTTLWTVDTFAAIGSSTVAGLVGRPVCVVRATLRLDAPDDLDEVDVVAAGGPPARAAAFAALAAQRFVVKLGTLTRTDDALLGFYVDDDYSRLHLVDRVVATQALDSGRQRGQLGLLGQVSTPPVDPLDHPYLVPDGTVTLRVGDTVRLTLLMLPVGRVHLTSGILPRKHLALADDWVTPGLRRLVPSVRVGPVLVDPAEIRLPLVTLLGDQQTFTRRTGPLTWKDDAILAATQTAYLPRLPHEVQEGWVRVTPDPTTGQPPSPATGSAGGNP